MGILSSTETTLTDLPPEILLEFIKTLDIRDLLAFQNIDDRMAEIYRENEATITRHFMQKYVPDYLDRTNFIYVEGGAEYMNWPSMFDAYTRYYTLREITLYNRVRMTSFPIFPNMTRCRIYTSELVTFPVQPSMKYFTCQNSKLESFPVQPEMLQFVANSNKLKSFPSQPKMRRFVADDNLLESFPVQPRMTHFVASNNVLTSFRTQPRMKYFVANNNLLESFSEQPRLEACTATGNPIDVCGAFPDVDDYWSAISRWF